MIFFLLILSVKFEYIAATRNNNAASGKDSVNERTIPRWNAKFKTGDESLANDYRGRPETVADNEVLLATVDKTQAILLEIMQKN